MKRFRSDTGDVMKLEFTVNGVKQQLDVDPTRRLLDILRENLGLAGTKEGCGEGECGTCTVLMDGKAVCSCLVLASQARMRDIVTVEGLAKDGRLDALQSAFIEKGAIQCGYCTPGMLMSAKALLTKNPHPTRPEIRSAIEGNLCRCTGYTKIIDAVETAAQTQADKNPLSSECNR